MGAMDVVMHPNMNLDVERSGVWSYHPVKLSYSTTLMNFGISPAGHLLLLFLSGELARLVDEFGLGRVALQGDVFGKANPKFL